MDRTSAQPQVNLSFVAQHFFDVPASVELQKSAYCITDDIQDPRIVEKLKVPWRRVLKLSKVRVLARADVLASTAGEWEGREGEGDACSVRGCSAEASGI